jgi:hypothetical protein
VGGIGNKCAQTIHLCRILYALFNIQNSKVPSYSTSTPLSLHVELFPQLFLCPVACPIFRVRLLLGGSRDTLVMYRGFPFLVWPETGHDLETLSLPALTGTCDLRLLTSRA